MNKFDSSKKNNDNSGGTLVISNGVETLQINKRDLTWIKTGDHEHHYLPDFTDETEGFVALSCAIPGCIHGVLQQKKGKDFMDWLEKHRAKA